MGVSDEERRALDALLERLNNKHLATIRALYIEVTARRSELVAALAERGVTATEEGSSLVVEGVSGEGYDRIRDALVAADAPLRRLAPRRRTLSELFQPRGATDGDEA